MSSTREVAAPIVNAHDCVDYHQNPARWRTERNSLLDDIADALRNHEQAVRADCARMIDKQADTLRRAAHIVQQPTDEALRMAELAIAQLNEAARSVLGNSKKEVV